MNAQIWNKGKTLSVEHKQHLSESLKGRVTWNKGVKLSDEHKQKISNSQKKRYQSSQTQ